MEMGQSERKSERNDKELLKKKKKKKKKWSDVKNRWE